jgi:hypothetical protein
VETEEGPLAGLEKGTVGRRRHEDVIKCWIVARLRSRRYDIPRPELSQTYSR